MNGEQIDDDDDTRVEEAIEDNKKLSEAKMGEGREGA